MMTVGHSNRTLEELIEILRAHGVELLIDIRTIPKSRYNPQFNADSLPDPLRTAGIDYLPMPQLGGLRHARKDSINTGWRNLSFRGYADYMQTPEFEAAIDELLRVSQDRQAAIMCAEAVPWRCHRSLVADALTARGYPVEHIMSAGKRAPHKLTEFAKVSGENVSYPGETLDLFRESNGS